MHSTLAYMYMYVHYIYSCIYMYVIGWLYSTCTTAYNCMFGRKEKRSKQSQTNNKTKQHSTPKAVTFPKKNELPQVQLSMKENAGVMKPPKTDHLCIILCVLVH